MFKTHPPHGYSPQLLSESGTAELFVLSSLALEAGQAFATALESHGLLIPIREHESVRPRTPTIPVSVGSALLH
jgi:hypothetical protein